MEIKIRFTTYFRKQITSVLMCCSRLLSLTFLLHIKQRSSEKRSAPCRAVGAARRPVKTAGLLD
ncbi:MAG: hypothetical protein SO124_00510 [Oscillospiraceae bacterium]|nr:hypothetical protein [Oscillospiraceae bacterium]